ncbi:MAG: protein-L-isoaspartate(D-aspartate) O-methyltransferase [Proteobacteria bacterium]|nr:protein-L-isoaspartate(D-aspartate) O-methyltransferase [Pseudomonadota bacterium]MCH8096097.1 protein-L-isoaspartate(D-aspartate) O-methyltransferase [Pseudomonadota bacterium]
MSVEPRQIRLIMELRQHGIGDAKVLGAIERVPREMFVPEPFRDQAYENTALPIGAGQTISQPLVVALMTQALELGERMRVLEIGTGSGYQAAVLSHLCRRVYTMERHSTLLKEAEARFKELGLHNVTAMTGNGIAGWPEQAPFPRILATAAAVETPPALLDQLEVGGIMVIPLGANASDQNVVRLTKREDGFESETLWPVRFVPMIDD